MARREFSRKVKAQAWVRCGGRCEKCTDVADKAIASIAKVLG